MKNIMDHKLAEYGDIVTLEIYPDHYEVGQISGTLEKCFDWIKTHRWRSGY